MNYAIFVVLRQRVSNKKSRDISANISKFFSSYRDMIDGDSIVIIMTQSSESNQLATQILSKLRESKAWNVKTKFGFELNDRNIRVIIITERFAQNNVSSHYQSLLDITDNENIGFLFVDDVQ